MDLGGVDQLDNGIWGSSELVEKNYGVAFVGIQDTAEVQFWETLWILMVLEGPGVKHRCKW